MDIEFYESSSGRRPVEEYLDGLSHKARKKIIKTLEVIRDEGIESLKQLNKLKKLRDTRIKLYELRFYIDKFWYRIFCTFYKSKCWLLHIFDKKSNETPKRHIITAENRAKEIFNNY